MLQLRKRVTGLWGGNFSYTYSQLKDNQIGQFGSGNYLAFAAAPGIVDNYNYIPGSPNYNPDVDYGVSLNDMPHKIVIAPIVQLPFGPGRALLNNGWCCSTTWSADGRWPPVAIDSERLSDCRHADAEHHEPATAPASGPTSCPVSIRHGARRHHGRLRDNPADNLYLNPAAFSLAPAFTLGNAPFILPGVRSPVRNSLDLALNKDFPNEPHHQSDASARGDQSVQHAVVHADGQLDLWQRQLRPGDDAGELLAIRADDGSVQLVGRLGTEREQVTQEMVQKEKCHAQDHRPTTSR